MSMPNLTPTSPPTSLSNREPIPGRRPPRAPRPRGRVFYVCTLLAGFLLLLAGLGGCSAAASGGRTSTSTPSASATTDTAATMTAAAAGTPTAPATATSAPITSCAQVSGFGSAGSISTGSHFSEVSFPAHTVGVFRQTFETNSYQFRLISACTAGTTAAAIRAHFSNSLPPTGFIQSLTFPYQGNPNTACGDPYCWYKGSAHPSFQAGRYVSLENVSAIGSVVTYTLRLSITPLVFTNITIKGTYDYDFDLVDNPDVWWEIVSSVQRQMVPKNGATLADIGVTNLANVTYAQLTGLSYSTTPIDGNADPSNKLYPGVVWAVHTDSGHYVKVLVDGYGIDGIANDITVNYVLYDFTF